MFHLYIHTLHKKQNSLMAHRIYNTCTYIHMCEDNKQFRHWGDKIGHYACNNRIVIPLKLQTTPSNIHSNTALSRAISPNCPGDNGRKERPTKIF